MPAVIRPQLLADADAVRDVLTHAFDDNGEVATLSESLLDGRSRFALVAELDGVVVGHAQASRCWVDAPQRVVDVLVLSPVGVAPDHQRRGIGGQLVRTALDAAEHIGAPLMFLEGDPRYYRRFGFVPGSTHGFTRPSTRIPPAAFQVAILATWERWMTGALVYCDTFWTHDAVGLRP